MALEMETFHQQVRFGTGGSSAVLPEMPAVPQPWSVRSYCKVVCWGWAIPNKTKPLTFGGREIIDIESTMKLTVFSN